MNSQNTLLSPKDFRDAISGSDNCEIIDVRTAEEYSEGHLKGATLLDVKQENAFRDSVRKLDNGKEYFIYCRSGKRSAHAAGIMRSEGLHVVDMDGGIEAWKREDLPVEK